jgi:hypothetical protein
MEKYLKFSVLALISAGLIIAAPGCEQHRDIESEEPDEQDTGADETAGMDEPEAPAEPAPDTEQADMPEEEAPAEEPSADVQHAQALWEEMEDYEKWPVPEGFAGWKEGKSPHGAILRYYVNPAAQEDLTQDGAIIIKENYAEESEDALKSVTVMEKRAGYDPETGDWFYVKYSPKGKVMTNPAGAELAGLVGKGGDMGCIPCHSAAGGDDYLFMND